MEDWIELTSILLNKERDSEKDEILESLTTLNSDQASFKGISICNVCIDDVNTGLYGRFSAVFSSNKSDSLPSHKLGVGSIYILTLCTKIK